MFSRKVSNSSLLLDVMNIFHVLYFLIMMGNLMSNINILTAVLEY